MSWKLCFDGRRSRHPPGESSANGGVVDGSRSGHPPRFDGRRSRHPPQRIVCLTEEPTEILYALGEQARIVGISAYTERPPQAKREHPVVSAFVGGSVSKIAALQPDLVIGFSDIQADLAKKLIAANLQVLIFNQRSVQEILDTVLLVARLVGREAKGLELVGAYVERLHDARRRAQALPRRPKVYFEEWGDPMICGIRWVSELIEVAGGRDIFAEEAGGLQARDRFVTSDEVLRRNPDVMMASWCGKPLRRDTVYAREGWRQMRAIADDELHELDPAIILQPGPACLTDGLDALQAIIHRAAAR